MDMLIAVVMTLVGSAVGIALGNRVSKRQWDEYNELVKQGVPCSEIMLPKCPFWGHVTRKI